MLENVTLSHSQIFLNRALRLKALLECRQLILKVACPNQRWFEAVEEAIEEMTSEAVRDD